MQTTYGNLFHSLPLDRSAEVVDLLHQRAGLKIERIISNGQASPPGFWYDNPQEEWVLLLSGAAALTLEDKAAQHIMHPGDWLHIPAHCRHRIEWTDAGQPTVWLAVHHPIDPP